MDQCCHDSTGLQRSDMCVESFWPIITSDWFCWAPWIGFGQPDIAYGGFSVSYLSSMPKVMGLAFYTKHPCLVSRIPFALSYLWIFTHVLPSSWNTFPNVFPPHPFFSLPFKIPLIVGYLVWMSYPLKSLPSPLPPAVWDLPLLPAHPDLHLLGCSPWHAVTTCSHFSLRIRGNFPGSLNSQGHLLVVPQMLSTHSRVQLIQVLIDVGQVLLTLSTDVPS